LTKTVGVEWTWSVLAAVSRASGAHAVSGAAKADHTGLGEPLASHAYRHNGEAGQ